MNPLLFLSWQQVAVTGILYLASIIVYRLFFHPLAKFPGPKLAAATRWYDCYYDVFLPGQYTWKIAELHKRYGPIVRISPHELHVNDPEFFKDLYCYDGRWNKYSWSYDAFGAPFSTICCADHDLHKERRAPLERYMSKANVERNRDIIQGLTFKLCDRIDEFHKDARTVNLGSALSAFVRDVATEWLLGKSFNNLDKEDFNSQMTAVFQGGGHVWRMTKHFRWFGPLMKSIPPSIIKKIGDKGAIDLFSFLDDMLVVTKETLSLFSTPTFDKKADDERSIIQAIVQSKLPPNEKNLTRVFDDVSTVTGAAFETTAAAIRLILFYVYSNPTLFDKLRTELASVASQGPNESVFELASLEQLPYLTAVITEGLRLSSGVATRQARIAPDRELVYDKWRIPMGTPVGMTTLLMHMNEKLYPDPERFVPERWMDPEMRRKADRTFAPFSRGTRNCLGMHLAFAEMYMVTAALVHRFEFGFDGASPAQVLAYSDEFIIGTKDRSGLKAYVTRRN
ncbi:cytochrome P450 [Hypoxylon trugodes]|uniref:cytochrome P450 n=1 Tax=Hypoxylon trugodes TaxID=326681 RepID=UPI0021A0778F|nr:cytochrome P450 [Hypoxylon trugodes]KAI1393370.1 cytochrome P450 [Hypoxylon trugodes]